MADRKPNINPAPDSETNQPSVNSVFPSEKHPHELDLSFWGTAKGYFQVWIVNLCLTLLTFGIFSAWAKVRKKRYLYSHTTLEGTGFQYLSSHPLTEDRIRRAQEAGKDKF